MSLVGQFGVHLSGGLLRPLAWFFFSLGTMFRLVLLTLMVAFLETKMGILGFRGCDLPDARHDIWSKVWFQIYQWKNVIFSMGSMANSIFGDVRILNLELDVKITG